MVELTVFLLWCRLAAPDATAAMSLPAKLPAGGTTGELAAGEAASVLAQLVRSTAADFAPKASTAALQKQPPKKKQPKKNAKKKAAAVSAEHAIFRHVRARLACLCGRCL